MVLVEGDVSLTAQAAARISGAADAVSERAGRVPSSVQGLAGGLAGAVSGAVLFDVGAALASCLFDLQQALDATASGLRSHAANLEAAAGGSSHG